MFAVAGCERCQRSADRDLFLESPPESVPAHRSAKACDYPCLKAARGPHVPHVEWGPRGFPDVIGCVEVLFSFLTFLRQSCFDSSLLGKVAVVPVLPLPCAEHFQNVHSNSCDPVGVGWGGEGSVSHMRK